MKNAIQGAQMLFVAFGALVLVPLLTGLDPNVALFGAGLGTLLFQLITRRSVPIFLLFFSFYRSYYVRHPNLGHSCHYGWLDGRWCGVYRTRWHY